MYFFIGFELQYNHTNVIFKSFILIYSSLLFHCRRFIFLVLIKFVQSYNNQLKKSINTKQIGLLNLLNARILFYFVYQIYNINYQMKTRRTK